MKTATSVEETEYEAKVLKVLAQKTWQVLVMVIGMVHMHQSRERYDWESKVETWEVIVRTILY